MFQWKFTSALCPLTIKLIIRAQQNEACNLQSHCRTKSHISDNICQEIYPRKYAQIYDLLRFVVVCWYSIHPQLSGLLQLHENSCQWNASATTLRNIRVDRSLQSKAKRIHNKLCVYFKGYTLFKILTHLPLVPHICVGELNQHWFR